MSRRGRRQLLVGLARQRLGQQKKVQIGCNIHLVTELVKIKFPGNSGPARRVSSLTRRASFVRRDLGIALRAQKLVSGFYEVMDEEKTVSVLAIGVKEGNQLFIGRQEFEL